MLDLPIQLSYFFGMLEHLVFLTPPVAFFVFALMTTSSLIRWVFRKSLNVEARLFSLIAGGTLSFVLTVVVVFLFAWHIWFYMHTNNRLTRQLEQHTCIDAPDPLRTQGLYKIFGFYFQNKVYFNPSSQLSDHVTNAKIQATCFNDNIPAAIRSRLNFYNWTRS